MSSVKTIDVILNDRRIRHVHRGAAERIPRQTREWMTNVRRKEVDPECLGSTPWKQTSVLLDRAGTKRSKIFHTIGTKKYQ